MEKVAITSSDNSKIKLLKKLRLKKYRNQLDEFVIENAKIIKDALIAGIQPESLYMTNTFVEENDRWISAELKSLSAQEYFGINETINKSFSELVTPPGIAAIYKKIHLPITYDSHIIYLNGINDPGNVGAILRSALAFGLKNIVVDESCADIYNAKTLQAAKDSIFKLRIAGDKDQEILKNIKTKMKIFSTRMQQAEKIEILKQEKKICLVLGSESHGVSKEIQSLSDGFVKIDMSKEVESLNVASAAAILFYQLVK
ncbi:TrmH family RNA methyltransferase [Patescibacteria group bacterium]